MLLCAVRGLGKAHPAWVLRVCILQEGRADHQSVSVCAWVSAMVHVGALYTWPFCSM